MEFAKQVKNNNKTFQERVIMNDITSAFKQIQQAAEVSVFTQLVIDEDYVESLYSDGFNDDISR